MQKVNEDNNIQIKDEKYKLESSEMVVEHINMLCKSNNKQVFVLIDEYDNFANELITGGK
ncbi:AAA family ATPase [Clostridium estertheticum]|uniref:AAA family ATPase n=1 Tax=Clostridium estertheticum TaxID=238834 RepID=UPI001CF17FB5|nr:AAA family ATPase [Clostridium estertheticum]MCB2357889.1 AAA family ATPase [Clostridium estertheticum]